MKIVLVGLNARFTHSNLALRGFRQLLRQTQPNCRLIEFSINQGRLEILEKLYLERPEVVLFSVYIWNGPLVASLLPDLKKLLPQVKIVLGGPEVSYQSQNWLGRHPEIDLLVQGPGEAALLHLAETNFSDWPASRTLAGSHLPLARLPLPYCAEDWPDLQGRYLYYEGSRGCPFACAYCLSARDDLGLEFLPVDRVLADIKSLLGWAEQGGSAPIIKFVDRTFNAKPERARQLWQALGRLDTRALFHFEVHPGLLTDEDFAVFAAVPAGRFQFEIGVQSTNPKALQAVTRFMPWTEIKPKLERLCQWRRIPIHLDLIAGLPGDSLADIGRSLNELFDLGPQVIQLGFLKNLPGSPIHDQASSLGLVCQTDPPYQILHSPWLSAEDLIFLRRVEHLVDGLWNEAGLYRELRALVGDHRDLFGALTKLVDRGLADGFDFTTRNRQKLQTLVSGL